MGGLIATIVGVVLFFVALLGGVAWLSAYKCTSQWERSGLKAEWALVQGCVVQRKDGTWVPASAIRDMAQ